MISKNLSVLLLLLVSIGGCQAPIQNGPRMAATGEVRSSSDIQSVQDADDLFGPVTCAAFSGSLTISERTEPIALYWLEASYAPYDIDQSRQRFVGQGELAAILVLPDHCVPLIGARFHSTELNLFDMDLVIPPDLIELDRPGLAWRLKNQEDSGGIAAKPQHTLHIALPNNSELLLHLASYRLGELNSNSRVEATLAIDDSKVGSIQVSVGETLPDDLNEKPDDYRVVEMELRSISHVTKSPRMAIASNHGRKRRLAGPVAPGCAWTSKAAFVHTLQDLNQAGIAWHTGQFDDSAAAIVQQRTGGTLTKEDFFKQIEATFGTIDSAVTACCPYAEVRHIPMVQTPSAEGPRFIGVIWRETKDPSGRPLFALDIVPRMIPPPTRGDSDQWKFGIIHVPFGRVLDDVIVTLRMIPLEKAELVQSSRKAGQ